MGASAVCWRPACAAWGEPARPGFSPEGKRERGDQIPCCRRLILPALDHEAVPAVATADFVRQLRGPHLSTCP